MRHWLVVHKSLRGQVRRSVGPTSHGITLPFQESGFTVISRIFHRGRPRSWQFNYQTRNFAQGFLLIAMDHILFRSGIAAYGLSCEPRIELVQNQLNKFRTFYIFLRREVASCNILSLFTRFCNRPSPSLFDFHQTENLRTIIVIADIHQGLYSSPLHLATKQRP